MQLITAAPARSRLDTSEDDGTVAGTAAMAASHLEASIPAGAMLMTLEHISWLAVLLASATVIAINAGTPPPGRLKDDQVLSE
jgi:hypothetical protein